MRRGYSFRPLFWGAEIIDVHCMFISATFSFFCRDNWRSLYVYFSGILVSFWICTFLRLERIVARGTRSREKWFVNHISRMCSSSRRAFVSCSGRAAKITACSVLNSAVHGATQVPAARLEQSEPAGIRFRRTTSHSLIRPVQLYERIVFHEGEVRRLRGLCRNFWRLPYRIILG